MPYMSYHTAPISSSVPVADIEFFASRCPYQASKLRSKGFEHAKRDFYEAFPNHVPSVAKVAKEEPVKLANFDVLKTNGELASGADDLEKIIRALSTAHHALKTIQDLKKELHDARNEHYEQIARLKKEHLEELESLKAQVALAKLEKIKLCERAEEDEMRIMEQMERAEESERDVRDLMTNGQREVDSYLSRALRSESELKETKKTLDETKAHLKHFVEVASKQSARAEKYKKSAAEAMSVAKEAHSANVEKRATIESLRKKLVKSSETAKLAVEAAQFFQHNVGELQIEPDTDLLSDTTLERFMFNPPSSPQNYENELFEILNRRYSKIGLKVVKNPIKLSEAAKKYLLE